ncbi:MAG: tetratricopeptide repeat protein, partial [Deltaproteobacteria bacterium]|nr:tetratricopeptide repeat protein [Deltaproteobacteria bacterium]
TMLATIFSCSTPLLKTPQRAPSEEQKETTNITADINEAKKNTVQAQQNAKSLAEYHFSMAQAYVAEGNPDRAIEEYKLALVFDPNSPLIHTRLVAEYIKKGSLSDAMESCKEALKIDPNYIDALLILAGLYSATHEQELALKEYDKILKKLPMHEETTVYKVQILHELNRPLEAVKILKQFIKKYNKESHLAWYYLGRSYQKLKQEKNAIEAYDVALKIKPTFYQAALSLGSIYEEKKTYPKALAIYKEIFSQTQDLIAANRIVTILLKEEKYKEALPFLDSISILDADDMNSQVKLGLVQMELKSYNQAIENLRKKSRIRTCTLLFRKFIRRNKKLFKGHCRI